jgi:hypothetical protein
MEAYDIRDECIEKIERMKEPTILYFFRETGMMHDDCQSIIILFLLHFCFIAIFGFILESVRSLFFMS